MADTGDNPGWTPDIARSLIVELRKTSEIQREIVHILGDLRDELVRAREWREKLERRKATKIVGSAERRLVAVRRRG